MADREDFATAVGSLIKGRLGNYTSVPELSNADLNTMTTPGSYGYWDGAQNAPSGLRGNVWVSEIRTLAGAQEAVYQIALERDGRIWMRDWARSTNAWRAWARVPVGDAPDAPEGLQSHQLPVGGDLNDATTPGIYGYWGKTGSLPAMTNAPSTLHGNMLVSEIRTTGGVVDQVAQLVIERGGVLYAREWRRATDAWSDWNRVGGTVPDGNTSAATETTSAGFKTVPLALSVGSGDQNTYWQERGLRIPVQYNAPIGRWRLHVRNWNPFTTKTRAGSVSITGMWLGTHDGAGGTPAGTVQLMGAATTPADGSEWVSPWMDNDLGGNVERLLMLGYTGAGTDGAIGIRGTSWQTAAAADAASETATTTKEQLFPFEMWIEAETPSDTPVYAVVGDSIAGGSDADRVLFGSWLSLYCRRVGALPVHVAAFSDSMVKFMSVDHWKVERWAKFAPADAVIWAIGSNDIGPRPTIEAMTGNFYAMREVIERNVGPVRYATTITPRGVRWDAEQTAIWEAWNAEIPSLVDWKAVFDFSTVVSGGTGAILPEYDADGVHLNSAGYQALADSIQILMAPTPPSAIQGARLDRLEYWSGVRDLSGVLINGWVGNVTLCRDGNGISLYVEGLDSSNATGTAFMNLPVGWRPIARPGARVFRALISAGSNPAVPHQADIDGGGNVRVFTTPGAGGVFSGSIEFTTRDPIPATLPGNPA